MYVISINIYYWPNHKAKFKLKPKLKPKPEPKPLE